MANISNIGSNQKYQLIISNSSYEDIKDYVEYLNKSNTSSYIDSQNTFKSNIATSVIICAPQTKLEDSSYTDSGNYNICITDENSEIVKLTPDFNDYDLSYFKVVNNQLTLSSEFQNKILTINNLKDYTKIKGTDNNIPTYYYHFENNELKIEDNYVDGAKPCTFESLIGEITYLQKQINDLKSNLNSNIKEIGSTYFVINGNKDNGKRYLWTGSLSEYGIIKNLNQINDKTLYVITDNK